MPESRVRIFITASVMLATIMQVLDSTIANVALPHMEGSQAEMTGYVDDLQLLMLLAISVVPFVLLMKPGRPKPARRGERRGA